MDKVSALRMGSIPAEVSNALTPHGCEARYEEFAAFSLLSKPALIYLKKEL